MSYQLYWIFLSIAIVSILMNILLIFLANRETQQPCEIKLAVILAKVDLIFPITVIIAILIKFISGKDISIIPNICQVKGPINYIGVYLSMLLLALVSFSRVSLKSQLKVTGVLKYIIINYSLLYFTLIIVAACYKKFTLLPNGIDCAPLLLTDGLSTSISLFSSGSFILCLLITLGCYISRKFRILMGDYKDSIIPLPDRALISFANNSTSLSQTSKILIAIKTAIICGTYFFLIVPACILIMIEATVKEHYSPLVSNFIGICVNSISLVNPCLLIFTHSFFMRQLQGWFTRRVSKQ